MQVFGEKDADGFYWGEAGSRSGFVPCNMVSEVQVGPLYCTALWTVGSNSRLGTLLHNHWAGLPI